MNRGYRMLPHTSDAYIEAWGRDVNEAFEQAAKGMFSVILDLRRVKKKEKRQIQLELNRDRHSLLYAWLERLLILFDTEKFVPRECNFRMIKEGKEGYKAYAYLTGEKFDASRHSVKREVKAVTYHAMEILEGQQRCTVRFILDL
ncbi:MAG: archease [Conexivisphaerales archaeon]